MARRTRSGPAQAAAAELVRVCRPGGTIGLISWTPSGFIGQMFATMKPYAPPPPPGAQPPPLWGDRAHVTDCSATASRWRFDRGSDSTVLDWEYLLLIARRN